MVRVNLRPEGSVKKKKRVRARKEAAADRALNNKAVENNLTSSDSSRAISRVRTRLIPKSENSDIKPKIDNAAE